MKIGYGILKLWIKCGLYLYYGKIQLTGTENIPVEQPLLFLPNHQNALIDVLLIAVSCKRRPYFLTRSDVFRNPKLKHFFNYLQMIPVYRIRDGRDTVKQNEEIFEKCAQLLAKGKSIVIFPEANHNLKRRVRPLSNGFVRILFMAQEKCPDLDVRVLPVGLNYKHATEFPDQVGILYGSSIPFRKIWVTGDLTASTQRTKKTVKGQLMELTTHIEDLEEYDKMVSNLKGLGGVDYLKPKQVNAMIANMKGGIGVPVHPKKEQKRMLSHFFRSIFHLLNLPVMIGWRVWIKPKVWEPEFVSTFRFGFALFAMPVYYLFLIMGLAWAINLPTAFLLVASHFLFNWAYIKLA